MATNSEKEIAVLIDKFKTAYNYEKSPRFFLTPADLYKLSNIPNFHGVSIYNGKTYDGDDVLILLPVIKNSDPQNVYSQNITVNGSERTVSTVVELSSKKTILALHIHQVKTIAEI